MKRTGYDFAELHSWIDESAVTFGYDHRIERHYFNEDDKNAMKGRWGEKAIIEWLFHIATDNLETAFKMSKQSFSYGDKTYNLMQFGLSRSGYIHCDFKRVDERVFYSIFEHQSQEGRF